MIRSTSGRGLAAGALALYALVVGVLVPLHELLEAGGPRPVPVAGLAVDGDCQDRDCHEPSHHHRTHVHDPATCVSCAQARAAGSPAPAVAVAGPEPLRASVAPSAAPAEAFDEEGALPPARAPPVLS